MHGHGATLPNRPMSSVREDVAGGGGWGHDSDDESSVDTMTRRRVSVSLVHDFMMMMTVVMSAWCLDFEFYRVFQKRMD